MIFPLHATARLQTSIWALDCVGIGGYFPLGRGDCEDCGITLPPHFSSAYPVGNTRGELAWAQGLRQLDVGEDTCQDKQEGVRVSEWLLYELGVAGLMPTEAPRLTPLDSGFF